MTLAQLNKARSLGWICDPETPLADAVLSALLWLEIVRS